jgi:hypothetical protein
MSEVLRRTLSVQFALASLRDTAPQRDTLPSRAVALARVCSARFPAAKASTDELPVLFTLALQASSDTLAREIVRLRLKQAVNVRARLHVLHDAVNGYIDAEPARWTEAIWATTLADSLAHRNRENSLPLHVSLLLALERTTNDSLLAGEITRIITLGHTLDFNVIRYQNAPVIDAWAAALEAAFINHPNTVLALAEQAREDLSRFPGAPFVSGAPSAPVQTFDFARHTAAEVRDKLLPFNPDQYKSDRIFAPVTTSTWFPAPLPAWPPKGKISIIFYGSFTCGHRLNVSERGCWESLQQWRTFAQRHASQGVALTIVEQRYGYAIRTLPLSPSAEADSLDWYYHTYVGMPATLAVIPTALVRQMPLPDGRRWFADTTALGRTIGIGTENPFRSLTLIYDRNGSLLYAGQERDDLLMQKLILRALSTP